MFLACEAFHLSAYDLRNIIIHGFKSAFLRFDEKVKLLRVALREMDELLRDAYPGTFEPEKTIL
jgi:adenosine deaminase